MLQTEAQKTVPRQATSRMAAKRAFLAPEEVRMQFVQIGALCRVSAGQTIFCQDEPLRGLFMVEHGRVALSAGDDPTRVTRIAESGSLLGLPATMTGRPYSLTAEAVIDTELVLIGPDDFRRLLREKPHICYSITRMLAEEIVAFRRVAVYTV